MSQRKAGVILGYVYIVAQTLVMLAYTPLLLRGIGQSEYGLYQLVGSIAAYMTIIESMLTSSALRFFCAAKANNDTEEMENTLGLARKLYRCAALLVVVLGFLVVALFLVAYSPTLSEAEIQEGVALLTVLLANIVMNMLNYITTVAISAYERFAFLKAMDLASVVVQPVLVLLIIQGCPYAIVVTAVQFVVSALVWVCKRIYVKKTIGIRPIVHKKGWAAVKPMLVFSATIAVAMIADIIFAKTDQLVIGGVLGTSAVAVYSVGYQIYSCYSSLGTVLSSVFMPHLSDIATKENSRRLLSDVWIRTGRLAFFIITAILTGFIFFGMEFITLWVGPGYEAAYWVAILMMCAYYVDILQKLALTILQVLDKYTFRSVVYVVSAAVNVPLTFALTGFLGVVGAALSSAIVLVLGSGLVMNAYYSRAVGLDVLRFWREVAMAARGIPVVCLFSIVINHLELGNTVTSFLLHVALFLIVYAAAACACMNEEERTLVKSFRLRRSA